MTRYGTHPIIIVAATAILGGGYNCRCGPSTDGAEVGADAAADAATGSDAGTDAAETGSDAGADAATTDAAPDAGAAPLRIGRVTVGDNFMMGFPGEVAGVFFAATAAGTVEPTLMPIPGAPDCYSLGSPPFGPSGLLDAGDLTLSGLTTDPLVVARGATGDYFAYSAGFLGAAGTPIVLDVAGGTDFAATSATVPTPDPLAFGGQTSDVTGAITVFWTAGNGDVVFIDFSSSPGPRRCISADDGAFTVAPAAFAPESTPSTGFQLERRIQTTVVSPLGTEEIRLRAFARDWAL